MVVVHPSASTGTSTTQLCVVGSKVSNHTLKGRILCEGAWLRKCIVKGRPEGG